MRAVEFVRDRAGKEPWREAAGRVAKHCYEHGVIALTAGTYSNVIRLLPPLVITEAQLAEGLDVMEAGIAEVRP
jgi:4-aminobutyrate aminotransferase/(S)-3-amino-2-methylpropionate transaminase